MSVAYGRVLLREASFIRWTRWCEHLFSFCSNKGANKLVANAHPRRAKRYIKNANRKWLHFLWIVNADAMHNVKMFSSSPERWRAIDSASLVPLTPEWLAALGCNQTALASRITIATPSNASWTCQRLESKVTHTLDALKETRPGPLQSLRSVV